jgi:hypothetical protein
MTYTVSQDARKGGYDTAYEVECRVSLPNLIYTITQY